MTLLFPSPIAPPRHWIAVASANHVARGVQGGFAQTCHGKAAPLRRARPGDTVIYYAPTETFGQRDKCQAFVAYGHFTGEVYQAHLGGFDPHRRDVTWTQAQRAPIAPLLPHLSFTSGKANWGAPFRWGFFEVPAHDRAIIAEAMGVAAHSRHDLSQAWQESAPRP
ncbi:EVE domain-containing protein [Rhodobacter sp. KR11]|uniref:EVE domain-containing protein n=1 Tax=Rhodobacter sp. KR11 TaxID=2974588 RepID=UPI002222A3DB|nr:EVE domain-containing protein [Rhodobacter sp. KR11]MCW1920629.1 EVE domain-containing protein [Rhodobacter sp. KR11]